MPKAISSKLSRVHQPAAGDVRLGSASGGGSGSMANSSNTTKNPIFNTDRFGQHILKNPLVAQGIVDKANLKSTETVLEVGPGTGNLTVRILEKAKKTVVVEMDPRMAAELNKRVQGKPERRKLEVIIGDFCKTELPYFDVCISNTPYQISSPLVFKLLSHRPLFRVAILMFQREFALRLLARPGSALWCRLSANVQLYAKVDHIMKVSRNSFRPPPQVESSVVRITPLNPPPQIRFEEFDGLARIVFSRRNKQIRACFFGARGVLDMMEKNWRTWCAEKEKEIDPKVSFASLVDNVLRDTGYTNSRAAQLDIDDLLKLLAAFHEEGIHLA
ncbi:putative rRNA (adenine-N6,N6-)-dimethyltransferase [Tilletiaria anomala UBC 951]|uniref:rRNA adenine N(6)-methyltransferase n=1 Tax=Tilletiaria anomala (strain ATCC 24038 / CBS 436.72 / UBC 951) TaxID=1037660 RepID=A0A066V880_TILAU|nr:putative rRNA (adenine-N6,N6-)-dimethyltransferase [Tilletiaria anomala UBC 951]KDN37922.1 putative rRNA (adenine-N6,N6-)-dimethyltransferase [Tilletiaria anomala UBC 951]